MGVKFPGKKRFNVTLELPLTVVESTPGTRGRQLLVSPSKDTGKVG